MTTYPTSVEELTDRELVWLFAESYSPAIACEMQRRATVRAEERRRQRRVRAFGRKRRLLKVLWPLVKLSARMEGRC